MLSQCKYAGRECFVELHISHIIAILNLNGFQTGGKIWVN